ncbi:FKBP-type peptidyl-prolyl cis-trans isomerase [Aurantivibrio infirmus]
MKKYNNIALIVAASAVFTVACSEKNQPQSLTAEEAETVAAAEQLDLVTLDERFSYAYGVDLADKFKREGIDLNVALMMAGMKDVFSGGEVKMSAEEVASTTRNYEKLHYEKKEAERVVMAEKNKKEGEAFLEANAKREGVTVTESGLQYKIITEGSGDYKPAELDEVTVHYVGTFIDGTEFDSSYTRNKPHVTIVKQLIEGWVEALQLMTVGAKWELTIPAELAYGEEGSGNYVGPNAVLIFEVELLDIKKE